MFMTNLYLKKVGKMQEDLKLTTRGRYAIMAMVELGRNGEGQPVPLTEIADKSGISVSYLEQLIAGLRKNGLVRSYRGPGGGYCLAKPSSEIVITDILIAAEDSTPAKRNVNSSESKLDACMYTASLWQHIGSILHKGLQMVSLDDVLEQRFHKTRAD
jgi:Rrf2 family iron-sulfur cluster assembly transcriptional regulator